MSITVKHDGSFDLATAKSSNSLNWRNREVTWADLLNKLSKTHYTHETHAEYLSSKKDRQDEIKNVGGYVGAYLSTGSRKKGNVLHRQLVTLDIDFATKDFWQDFCLMYGNAACTYTTHKHSPDKPRLRLILPLSRPVFADEYEAIARKIAGVLDIELFDDTTYQPERLMYWPSTSKDGEYVFEYQDGEWLDADKVLNSYTDWKDSSSWPISSRVDKVVLRNMVKQGDPTTKPGVIGAWCRTYGIAEAIETFLSDTYEPSDMEGRYSYKEGSTGGGLVIYEDKYAYSHHGSDPVSGKLSNSFDLVRVHKFGLKDDDAREGTAINHMPSYLAMVEFASQDPQVKGLIVTERLDGAKADFDMVDDNEPDEVIVEEDESWRSKLDSDKKGNVQATIKNVVIVLNNDSYLKGKIAFDDFEKCEVALSNLPWRTITHQTRRLLDDDDAQIRFYLEASYGINNIKKTEDAMRVIKAKTTFHPVRDYLKSVTWDGVNRVDSLFIDYMGAVDDKYTRAVTRKTLCAACARVFEPGIKFHTMLTFVGKQGLGKSSLIGKLGKQWFSDSFKTVHGKEAIEQIQGAWLVEVAELAGLKKSDIESVKSYISQAEDRYRVAYGRRVEFFPRQCIFFGSTNKRDFLIDNTGNRRFWPVDCMSERATKNIFKDFTGDVVDQVWAEAYIMYKKGETLYLSTELEALAFKVQEEHSVLDDREGLVVKYLDTLLPVSWEDMDVHQRRQWLHEDTSNEDKDIHVPGTVRRDSVCAAEIWCEVFNSQVKDMNEFATRPIHAMLHKVAGWEASRHKVYIKGYGTQRAYYRTDAGVEKFETKNIKHELN